MELQTELGYEKQVRAIVLFGDIRGFSTWEQSATNPEIEFKPLINRWRQLACEFGRRMGGHYAIQGDGILIVLEMRAGHNCGLSLRVLRESWNFTHAVMSAIKHAPWPRPLGFRIRLASGHVWKKGDGGCAMGGKVKCHLPTDYVGRHINMTYKLLRVAPDEPIVCHQSFVELASAKQLKKEGFAYSKIRTERRTPDGLLAVDMNSLWSLRKPGHQ